MISPDLDSVAWVCACVEIERSWKIIRESVHAPIQPDVLIVGPEMYRVLTGIKIEPMEENLF